MDRSELAEAVRIFHLAFADEHAPRFRGGARPAAFTDVWRFINDTEPQGFLAAREEGRLVGYAIFVESLKALQRRALLSGEAIRWAVRALVGGYDLRPVMIWRIFRNKLLFVTHGQKFRTTGDAQLLNVAVDPGHQGQGIARQLVARGLEVMRDRGVPEVRLEVRPGNASALRVYQKTGWREVGRTRDLEGEWVVMVANP